MVDRVRIPVKALNWEESHRRLSQALNELIRDFDITQLILQEQGALAGNTGTYANLATVANYTDSNVYSELSGISVDPVAGTITVAADGVYAVEIYSDTTGSNNNAYYGLQLIINPGPTRIVGAIQWDNLNPAMVFSAILTLRLTAGVVLSLQALASTGTLTFKECTFYVRMTDT